MGSLIKSYTDKNEYNFYIKYNMTFVSVEDPSLGKDQTGRSQRRHDTTTYGQATWTGRHSILDIDYFLVEPELEHSFYCICNCI